MSKDFPVRVKLSAIDKLTGPMNQITNAFPGFTRAINKSTQAMRVFDKETDKIQKNLKEVGGKMQSVGSAMTLGITLPVIAGTALSIKAFMDYETALIGVGKTTNLRSTELKEFGKSFLEMSTRIPVPVTELLNMGQAAAQLGVSGKDNILKFTETMAKLTKASNITGEEGATSLARLISVSKGDIGDVDRFAAAIVGLGNNFEVTESEILTFATRLASSTAIFKVSGVDALGMSTALASMGIQAELGSSAVQRGFMGINKAIGAGGKKLQALSLVTGIAANDLKEEFARDSVGVFQKFTAGLGKLGAEGKDITKVMEIFGLKGVGNIQVLGTLATNTEKFTKALEMSRKGFADNVALNDEFRDFLASLDNQMILAKNNIIKVAIAVGEKFKPALLALFDVVTKIAQFFLDNPWALNLAMGLAAVAAVIGPLLALFGTALVLLPSLAAGLGLMGISAGAAGAGLASMLVTVGILGIKVAAFAAACYAAHQAFSYLADATGANKIGEWLADKTGPSDEELMNQGAASVQAGIARRRSGLEANSKVSQEFHQRTNNARVDVNVRAPQNTTVTSESQNGFLSINRGLSGAF